jgi:hypothetical protein
MENINNLPNPTNPNHRGDYGTNEHLHIPCPYCKDRNPYCTWCNDSGGVYDYSRLRAVCIASPKNVSISLDRLPSKEPKDKRPKVKYECRSHSDAKLKESVKQIVRKHRKTLAKRSNQLMSRNQRPTLGDKHGEILNRFRLILDIMNA